MFPKAPFIKTPSTNSRDRGLPVIEKKRVADLLRFSFLVDDDGQPSYLSSRSGSRQPIADIEGIFDSKVLTLRSSEATVNCEVYWHRLPKEVSSGRAGAQLGVSVWLALPWAVSFVFGSDYPKNYIGKNTEAWRRSLESSGMSPMHIRSSVKSLRAKRRRIGAPESVEVDFGSELEFTITYGGLLCLCMNWSRRSGKHKRMKKMGEVDKALLLAEMLLQPVLSGRNLAFRLQRSGKAPNLHILCPPRAGLGPPFSNVWSEMVPMSFWRRGKRTWEKSSDAFSASF